MVAPRPQSRPWQKRWGLDLQILDTAHLADATAFMQWPGKGLVQRMSDGSNPAGWHWAYQPYSPNVSTFAYPDTRKASNFPACRAALAEDPRWGIGPRSFVHKA